MSNEEYIWRDVFRFKNLLIGAKVNTIRSYDYTGLKILV